MRSITLTFLLLLPPTAAAGPPLVVEARYPGASAGVVAETVAVPLEKALAGVAGVRRVRSLSRDGHCLVRLELGRSADSHKARGEAARRLRAAARTLPGVCAYLGVRLLPEADDSFLVVALRAGGRRASTDCAPWPGMPSARACCACRGLRTSASWGKKTDSCRPPSTPSACQRWTSPPRTSCPP